METLLKQILGEVKNLNQRVGDLEQGQNELGDRLENRIDLLDIRIDRLDTRIDQLDTRIDRLDTRIQGLDNRMNKLEIRIENEFIAKIHGLYDTREVQNDINERFANALDRIEAKVDVLQFDTAHMRRIK